MALNIWTECDGINHIDFLKETVWRIVETQEFIATRKLVDSRAEQDILEDMIEKAKPPLLQQNFDYHTLLCTPFRYPPLKYGSRFGNNSEASLWYGSLIIDTVMAEKAFYQFNFLRASIAIYDPVEIPLTIFSAQVKTDKGIKLTEPPFSNHNHIISSPRSYEASQILGASMRKAKIEAFNYYSARDPNEGVNVALFTPKAFLNKNPDEKSFQSWQCVANNSLIEFIRSSSIASETKSFTVDQFMVEGLLPFPAS